MNFDRNILNKGAIFAFFTFIFFWFNTQGGADSFLSAAFCSIFVMLCFTFISLIAAWEKKFQQKLKHASSDISYNNYTNNRNWKQEWEESKLRRKKATYDHIIKVHNMQKKSITSVDDGVSQFSHIFNVGEKAARPFFQNQHVQSVLGFSSSQSSFSKTSAGNIQKTKKVDSNFWDNVSQGVAKNEAKSEEVCADPNCSKPVSAFDFRCFKCRKRFCGDCESGKSIMCKACS